MKPASVWVLGVALLFLGLSPVDAQSPPDSGVTLKSSTQLVLVPTVVEDKSGSHVPGLTKDDFVLKQDGKRQVVAIFEEVKTAPVPAQPAKRESGTFSNFRPGGSAYPQLNLIVLDFVNTPYADQANARKELLKFLSDVADGSEPMCLFALTRDGLTLMHDFTDDPKLLADAVRKAHSNNSPMIDEAVVKPGEIGSDMGMMERIIRANLEGEAKLSAVETKLAASITVQALRQLAISFRGLPGRKSVIWASSGFPFAISSPARGDCGAACSDRGSADDLWKLMNDAQMAMYSVDLRAATINTAQNPGGVRPSDLSDPQFDTDTEGKWKREDASSTLRLFAENTGGKAFLGGSDLIQAFRQATEDDRSYYMLGYYVSRNSKPGWHPIVLSSTKKGTHLRYRDGFLLSNDTSPASAQSDMQLAVSSPFDFEGLPMSISWTGREAGKIAGKTRVLFDLVLPPNFAAIDDANQNHMVVDIAAVARNAKGEVVAQMEQRIETHLKPDGLEQIRDNGMTYHNGLQLPAGEYTVRFVVRDALANRVGSAAAPVKVSP